MNSRWLLGLLIVIFCGALVLRASRLDLRPMHGDEAVHAVKFNDLWSKGQYQYDPREYHGPILYYFALPAAKIFGARNFAELTTTTLRIIPAIFGTLMIGWLWLLSDGFGKYRETILWAALFTAVSPAMVFYSRYFIQEIPLVFFTLGLIACLWRASQSPSSRSTTAWMVGAGLNTGLMLASKETALIAMICIGIAWRFSFPNTTRKRDWLLSIFCAVAVATCLLTNFGRSWPDFQALEIALSTYFSRAGGRETQGEMHRHPWYQYFEWLFWYRSAPGPRWNEAFIGLLALIGLGWSCKPNQEAPMARFFAIFTAVMTAIYCALPYKTPWCVLGFWQGAIIMAGYGASRILTLPTLLASKPTLTRSLQATISIILLASCWNLLTQTRLANDRFFADRRNPWVYAHPTRDVLRLGERVQQLATLHPKKNAFSMAVMAPKMDYWPLPWELRAQTQVGYFEQPPNFHGQQLPILIAAKPSLAMLQKQMGPDFEHNYHIEYYGLRPGSVMVLCVEKSLWQRFLNSR